MTRVPSTSEPSCQFPCSCMNLIKFSTLLMNQGSYCSSFVFLLLCSWSEDKQAHGWADASSKSPNISVCHTQNKKLFLHFAAKRLRQSLSCFIFFFNEPTNSKSLAVVLRVCVYVHKKKYKLLFQSKRGKGCKWRVTVKLYRIRGSQPNCPFRNGSIPSLSAFCEK